MQVLRLWYRAPLTDEIVLPEEYRQQYDSQQGGAVAAATAL